MATDPTVLKSGDYHTIGPFKMTVADSVDGLLYMPDANGDLIVAAGNCFCGVPERRAKVGEYVSIRVRGLMVVTASAAINAQAPVVVSAGGKVATATVGTDQVHGWLVGPACTADGDVITIYKVS